MFTPRENNNLKARGRVWSLKASVWKVNDEASKIKSDRSFVRPKGWRQTFHVFESLNLTTFTKLCYSSFEEAISARSVSSVYQRNNWVSCKCRGCDQKIWYEHWDPKTYLDNTPSLKSTTSAHPPPNLLRVLQD